MNTKFPYEQTIDFAKYFDAYLQREDAIHSLPNEEELRQLAYKGIVKDKVVLAPLPEDEPAVLGDTVTLQVASALPKFNRPAVTVSIGRGLYDPVLENAVAGLCVGQSCQVMIQDQPVDAMVLGIKRKVVPEPTDAMVIEAGLKDYQGRPFKTVKDYVAYVVNEQTMSALATVNYYIMEAMIKDYPMENYDEEDIRILGELEREALKEPLSEEDGKKLSPEAAREKMDNFIKERYEWYKMKIQQCLIYLNVLGLPCEGATDPVDHYEVLSELTQKMFDKIKEEFARRTVA